MTLDEWCTAVVRHLSRVQERRTKPVFQVSKENEYECNTSLGAPVILLKLTKRPYIPTRIIEKSNCILFWGGGNLIMMEGLMIWNSKLECCCSSYCGGGCVQRDLGEKSSIVWKIVKGWGKECSKRQCGYEKATSLWKPLYLGRVSGLCSSCWLVGCRLSRTWNNHDASHYNYTVALAPRCHSSFYEKKWKASFSSEPGGIMMMKVSTGSRPSGT